MTDYKVIDINKLGLRERVFVETVPEDGSNLGMSGMRGMISRTVKRLVPTSHLNEEDALLIAQAGAVWELTPKALKGHPKWMARWNERKWFTDKKPVAPKSEPEPEEVDDEGDEPEEKPKRKRGRPAKRLRR